MTFGWYAGRPCRSTCPTRDMFRCSPLWLMASAGKTYPAAIAATATTTPAHIRLRDINMAPPQHTVAPDRRSPAQVGLAARAHIELVSPQYSADNRSVKGMVPARVGDT